jgi:hypothetical protein
MPRSIGANNRVYGKKESAYGTAPGGNFIQLPFYSFSLDTEQGRTAPTVIGVGTTRDPAAPNLDVVNVTGDAVVPVDLINIGHWLSILFGAPVTTGAGPDYTHTFKSGAATMPSWALEQAFPDVPQFFMQTGVRANTLQMNFSPSGEARATIGLVGQGTTLAGTTAAGTPTQATFTAFNQFQASIKRDGSPIGNVTEGSLNFSNNVEQVRTIRGDGKIEGADPGITNGAGSIRVRFADTTLLTAATGNTPVALELGYTISASRSLLITLHEVYLPRAKIATETTGGVSADFPFQASVNLVAGCMLTAVLKNQSAGATYS